MKQSIKDFKAIVSDKRECKEFFGGLACVLAAIVLIYFVICVFH